MADDQATQPQTDDNGDKFVQVGKYKIKVKRDTCIAAASCIAISPDTFDLDAMQKAIVKPDSKDAPENIFMAAQACPTKAIVIIDTETGKQIWPES